MFFFGDYQGTRQTSGITNQLTIPTSLAQSTCNPATNPTSATPGFCNLSEYTKAGINVGGQVYNPRTRPTVGNCRIRTQFCAPAGCVYKPNRIPITRIS